MKDYYYQNYVFVFTPDRILSDLIEEFHLENADIVQISQEDKVGEYYQYQIIFKIPKQSKLSDYTTEELKEEINRRGWYFHSWCEDDIQSVIDDQFEDDERLIDNPLNDDDIRIILEKIFDDHDANIGINWDVLYYGVDSYLDERKKSQNTPLT